VARFDMSGIDATVDEMRRLGEDVGPVADAMLLAGAAEVREAWRRAAEEAEHRLTGDMIASIGFPREPQDIGGMKAIDIYPQGRDEHGVRNAEKAFILHYGTSKLDGSRWIDLADMYCESTVVPAMTAVWAAYLETGRVPDVAARIGAPIAGAGIRTKRT